MHQLAISSDTGTAAIIFQYTVISGHNTGDLNYVGTGSLTPSGGSITATGGTALANLVLPSTTSADSLGGTSAVIVDTILPTVTITNADTADGTTTNAGTITYTATFSEDVTNFDAVSDITVSGTAGPTVAEPTGSGDTYTFTVTATTDGTVVVSIPAGAATDTAGNANTASGMYTVTVDTGGSSVLLSTATSDDGKQNTNTISYIAVFNDPTTNFVLEDIVVTGTASGGSPTASNFVATSPTAYTFDVVTTGDGTVIVTIPANVATDPAGNGNDASRVYIVTVDTIAPTVILSSTTPDGSIHNANTITYTATFSEDVTGFDAVSDITVSGTAGPTVAALAGSGDTYTFTVTTTTDGTVTVSIPADAATDAAEDAAVGEVGNGNTASGDYTVTVDTALDLMHNWRICRQAVHTTQATQIRHHRNI